MQRIALIDQTLMKTQHKSLTLDLKENNCHYEICQLSCGMNVKKFMIFTLYCILKHMKNRYLQLIYALPIEIVPSEDCHLKDYPYFVSLQKKSEGHFCGGSLISAQWVLTSASCCEHVKKDELEIFTGLISTSPRFDPRNSTVKEFFSHPKYSEENPHNNICILELAEPIFQNKFLSYARLHVRNWDNDADVEKNCVKGIVVGYGVGKNPESRTEDYIHCATTNLVDASMCNLLSSKSNSSFCTRPIGDTQSCFKKDGGPFVCNGVQFGIIAGQKSGCGSGYPDVNTDVSQYEKFIEKTLKHDKSQTPPIFSKTKFRLIIIVLYFMW